MIKLKENTTYLNTGNLFSRVFLVGENLGNKNLIIFDKKEDFIIFQKIWNFFYKSKALDYLETQSDFLGFLVAGRGIFATSKELFDLPGFTMHEGEKNLIRIERAHDYEIEKLIKDLIDFGYSYSAHLTKNGTYSKEGDIVSIKGFFTGQEYKISFFGDEVDEILDMEDTISVKDVRKLEELTIPNRQFSSVGSKKTIMDILDVYAKEYNLAQDRNIFVVLDFWSGKETTGKILKPIIFSGVPQDDGIDLKISPLGVSGISELKELLQKKDSKKIVYTKNTKTLSNFIEYNDIASDIDLKEIPPSLRYLESFAVGEDAFHICDDILSDIFIRKRSRKSLSKSLDLLLEIKPGDHIVHVDHGIGIFNQIIMKDLSGIKREYVEIEYAQNDKLFVPISELHRVSKYIGDESPKLSRLHSNEWQKVMKSTEVEVERIAKELLEIYAERSITTGYSFLPFPEAEEEFRNAFPYTYTPDQETSIKEILSDMESSKPMDRLLVGDVGFGKTEVAMNAIYRSFLNRKQSAFISPLVILAYEHYESLKRRLAQFGVRIEVMTRVTTQKEEKSILSRLRSGEIDCIIGTHRLLSEDVGFRNLGIVVIDEEHRFGVLDKEKLNRMRTNMDILSLSATPIPRSLNFALNGIKDISIITTPPPKKQPIRTLVSKWSDELITNAIKNEFGRGGQVLFIHNRIATIESVKKHLEKLLGKNVRITITHGQMNGIEVENRIIDFKNRKYDILLSTTVIENGVNFLDANTILIDEADNFGLSQLHQLRGRVGRGSIEGFCHLIYRKDSIPDDAKKRLLTIVNNTHLGAGFEIALRDLEIRGAGDILGIKQSGKSKETGLSLYLKLLEEKIEELKTGKKNRGVKTQIELNISYYIQDDFFSSEADKIYFFRNLETIETLEDLKYAYDTFVESNDTIPEEFENLFLVLKARIILNRYKVISLKKIGQSYVFEFEKDTDVKIIKEFLDVFDKGKDFILITVHKIKAETRLWNSDKQFLSSITTSGY